MWISIKGKRTGLILCSKGGKSNKQNANIQFTGSQKYELHCSANSLIGSVKTS